MLGWAWRGWALPGLPRLGWAASGGRRWAKMGGVHRCLGGLSCGHGSPGRDFCKLLYGNARSPKAASYRKQSKGSAS